MAKKENNEEKNLLGVTVKKEENLPEWYEQVVLKAELADFAPIKGFMIIRPNGYSLWEGIQEKFNAQIKKLNVRNAYFPVLIPESYFKKEAEHAKGFAPELAWIQSKPGDEERYAIRPTSETMIHDSFSKWVRSHRDLPLRVNQWCNVLRWEVKQTKMFLRSREFLWQEGHCVYASKKEADKEVLLFLDEYKKLMEEELAIPVYTGYKTEAEKFAGALYTTSLEALMPDGKALQMGTSHNLGQGFSKAFNVKFTGEDEKENYAWLTSWGISTRLIGAIVMVHGDNKGLIVPPRIAFNKLVMIPILIKGKEKEVLNEIKKLKKKLENFNPILDERENYSPGFKFSEWELKGIPVRLELGPKDIEKNQAVLVRRDSGEKKFVGMEKIESELIKLLGEIHHSMFNKAKKFLNENTFEAKNEKELIKGIEEGKMVLISFCEEPECEAKFKEKTAATSRVIPFNQEEKKTKCVLCGNEAFRKTFFAKNY
ncbi:MAG TPA: proline--tRNA ligase [archaeon]|nr:proline--tRNA ligase [archaeon]